MLNEKKEEKKNWDMTVKVGDLPEAIGSILNEETLHQMTILHHISYLSLCIFSPMWYFILVLYFFLLTQNL